MTAASTTPPPPAERRTRRRLVGVALLALLLGVAVGALVVARLQLTDPYRPGTVHRVVVSLNGCDRPGGLWLDERTWSSHDRLPAGWPRPPVSGSSTQAVVGTLEVTDTDQATFTADQGGSVHYVRLRPHAFDSLECPIA